MQNERVVAILNCTTSAIILLVVESLSYFLTKNAVCNEFLLQLGDSLADVGNDSELTYTAGQFWI